MGVFMNVFVFFVKTASHCRGLLREHESSCFYVHVLLFVILNLYFICIYLLQLYFFLLLAINPALPARSKKRTKHSLNVKSNGAIPQVDKVEKVRKRRHWFW